MSDALAELMAVIDCARRQMPLNPYVMRIHDVAATVVKHRAFSPPVVATPLPLPPSVVATCPECAKRRAAKAEAQARFRAKTKDPAARKAA
jgi:hypothetical protein